MDFILLVTPFRPRFNIKLNHFYTLPNLSIPQLPNAVIYIPKLNIRFKVQYFVFRQGG